MGIGGATFEQYEGSDVSLHQRESRTPYDNIDEAKTRSKRAAGELFGEVGLKREGTFDNAAGKAKETVDKAADKAGLPR